MSKFKRILSSDDVFHLHEEYDGCVFKIISSVEQTVLAKLAEQEPVATVSQETFSSNGTSDILTNNLPVGVKLYAHPIPSAPEAESFILRCDYCKKETDDPWHGSGFIGDVKSKHIHACDDCIHLLPHPAPSALENAE